jgi:GDP/UDP-N,N'-diacetylbacillosamine 2-epimerase (hydrolysing)
MKVGVLTSSRADYGIYLPLLNRIKESRLFELEIIAFGMHLQEEQGFTIRQINQDGYNKVHRVSSMPVKDEVKDIAKGYGQVIIDFAEFWSENTFDWILALGDRWEMSAAVQASIPYEIKIAHIHGGETTLGALDNIYRHQISLASRLHFTAAQEFSKRVSELVGNDQGVYPVGSISLEELSNAELPLWSTVQERFEIPFDEFILVTFHPESVSSKENITFAEIAYETLLTLTNHHNILITKANSDALGSLYNGAFRQLESEKPTKVKLVDALGKWNYFSALNQCDLVLGNSSSGIIEAASFGKWVINVGARQKGRLRNANTIDVPFHTPNILESVGQVRQKVSYQGENKYVRPNTCETIINTLAEYA